MEHLEVVAAPDELGHPPEFLEGVGLECARSQIAQFAGGRTARVLVPTGYLDPALGVSQGHEGVDKPPRRVRSNRRVRGVLVHLRGPAGHLDVQDALASELDLRRALVEMVATLDRRAVRMQDLLVRLHEGTEVGTADLLLAFDHELQVDRRTNAAVSGWARLWAEIVGNRTYSFRISRAFPASASTRARTSVRANPHTRRGYVGGP